MQQPLTYYIANFKSMIAQALNNPDYYQLINDSARQYALKYTNDLNDCVVAYYSLFPVLNLLYAYLKELGSNGQYIPSINYTLYESQKKYLANIARKILPTGKPVYGDSNNATTGGIGGAILGGLFTGGLLGAAIGGLTGWAIGQESDNKNRRRVIGYERVEPELNLHSAIEQIALNVIDMIYENNKYLMDNTLVDNDKLLG